MFSMACVEPPGEVLKVIPGDLPTEVFTAGLAGWGQSIAEVEGVVWAASEDEGRVESTDGEGLAGPWAGRGIWLGERSGQLLIGVSGLGLFDHLGALVWEAPSSRAFATNGVHWVVAEDDRVIHSDGRSWLLEDPRAVAMDGARIAALSCTDRADCRVLELGDSIVELGRGEAGGDLDFFEGVLWWGLPELEDPEGEGSVVSENGKEHWGRTGDHLGRSIGGGYAAGSTNGRQVPRVLRIQSLNASTAYAVDRSSGSHSVALEGRSGTLLVGVPGWVGDGGAVMVVGVEEAP
ncbi:MAG: hypothetical protein VXW32_16535 [Myxococcota bacterium]|nr:hypothetical protein [Myxococcota bacterium]